MDERGTPWLTVAPAYRVKKGWRVLLNGRNIDFSRGLAEPVQSGDTVAIFPPGR